MLAVGELEKSLYMFYYSNTNCHNIVVAIVGYLCSCKNNERSGDEKHVSQSSRIEVVIICITLFLCDVICTAHIKDQAT